MSTVLGGCDCGNLSVELELSEPSNSYRPRACDCSFCRKHVAAYVSDPKDRCALKLGRLNCLDDIDKAAAMQNAWYVRDAVF